MLVEDILNEMPETELTRFQAKINRVFREVGIVPHSTRHFLQRSTDGNVDSSGNARGDLIVMNDVLGSMSKFVFKYKRELRRKSTWAGILHDIENDLNIPFRLWLDPTTGKKIISLITIMKTPNFEAGNFKVYDV